MFWGNKLNGSAWERWQPQKKGTIQSVPFVCIDFMLYNTWSVSWMHFWSCCSQSSWQFPLSPWGRTGRCHLKIYSPGFQHLSYEESSPCLETSMYCKLLWGAERKKNLNMIPLVNFNHLCQDQGSLHQAAPTAPMTDSMRSGPEAGRQQPPECSEPAWSGSLEQQERQNKGLPAQAKRGMQGSRGYFWRQFSGCLFLLLDFRLGNYGTQNFLRRFWRRKMRLNTIACSYLECRNFSNLLLYGKY